MYLQIFFRFLSKKCQIFVKKLSDFEKYFGYPQIFFRFSPKNTDFEKKWGYPQIFFRFCQKTSDFEKKKLKKKVGVKKSGGKKSKIIKEVEKKEGIKKSKIIKTVGKKVGVKKWIFLIKKIEKLG